MRPSFTPRWTPCGHHSGLGSTEDCDWGDPVDRSSSVRLTRTVFDSRRPESATPGVIRGTWSSQGSGCGSKREAPRPFLRIGVKILATPTQRRHDQQFQRAAQPTRSGPILFSPLASTTSTRALPARARMSAPVRRVLPRAARDTPAIDGSFLHGRVPASEPHQPLRRATLSKASGGLASGFLHDQNVEPAVGIRIRF